MPFLPATSPPPNPLFYVGNSKTSGLKKRSQGFCPRLLFLERSPPLSTTEALHQTTNPFFGSTLCTLAVRCARGSRASFWRPRRTISPSPPLPLSFFFLLATKHTPFLT